MRFLLDSLREGAFVTRERARLIAFAVLAASVLGLLFLAVTAKGLTDARGRPLGTDFSNVYAAGAYVLAGSPAAPFDPERQHARERAIFGENTPFYGWHYPPFFLLVAAPLAALPYLWALALWQATTLGLYLLSIGAIVRLAGPALSPAEERWRAVWPLLALAYPAVFINIGHGHNGFLTAALLGFALVLLDRRPFVAGLLFGLLAYKPQFGLLIPLVLVATGSWRALAGGLTAVIGLAGTVTLLFGPEIWTAFAESARFTRTVVLESGDTGWHKIQSVFAWLRMWGAPVSLAYAGQGAVTVALAVSVAALWRGRTAPTVKAAALVIASLLATPYSLDYDLMALAPAIAFLALHGGLHGFGAYEKSALALLWLMPLAARSLAEIAFVPLGVWSMMAALALTLRPLVQGLDLAPRRWLARGRP